MNKETFLQQLGSQLPSDQVADIISYYAELIDDAVASGLDEETAITSFGSLEQIINNILYDYQEVPIAPTPLTDLPQFSPKFGLKMGNVSNVKSVEAELKNCKLYLVPAKTRQVGIRYFNSFWQKFNVSLDQHHLLIQENDAHRVLVIVLSAVFTGVVSLGGLLASYLLQSLMILLITALIISFFSLISSLFALERKVILFLPKKVIDRILINNRNGHVIIDHLDVGDLTVKARNGSLKVHQLTAFNADLSTRNGKIKIMAPSDQIFNNLSAFTRNGAIKVENLHCRQDIHLSARNGSIKGRHLSSLNFSAHVHNGTIKIDTIRCNKAELITRNGMIKTRHMSSYELIMQARNGTIKGDLINAEQILTHNRHGVVKLLIDGKRDDYALEMFMKVPLVTIDHQNFEVKVVSGNEDSSKKITLCGKQSAINLNFTK